MQLPFLIVHGALVWKVLLVALVAGACLALHGLRRLTTRALDATEGR